jgi:hypothetical protein
MGEPNTDTGVEVEGWGEEATERLTLGRRGRGGTVVHVKPTCRALLPLPRTTIGLVPLVP